MLFPAFSDMKDCIDMLTYMTGKIIVNKNILNDDRYNYLFSVDALNKLVLEGVPFRDAYKQIGAEINAGTFKPEQKTAHTHEGSIGNLCNNKIRSKMKTVLRGFSFEKTNRAIKILLTKNP